MLFQLPHVYCSIALTLAVVLKVVKLRKWAWLMMFEIVSPHVTQCINGPNFLLDLAGRSLHGCWTCRLRRKKCDEHRPSCSACTSLELNCHGYGPRPEWMDRGVLEREQALRVRYIVSQNKFKRQKKRLLSPQQNQKSELEVLPNGNVPSTSPLLLNSVTGTVPIKDSATIQDHLQTLITEGDVSATGKPMQTELFYGPEACMPACSQRSCSATTAIEDGDMEFSSGLSELSESSSASMSIMPNAYDADTQGLNIISPQDFQLQADEEALNTFCEPKWGAAGHHPSLPILSMSENLMNPLSLPQENSLSPFGIFGNYTSANSIICDNMEDELFMHYLDQVFHIQYPFYPSFNGKGRGWLFSVLRRTKSAYHGALALSQYHQYSTSSRHSIFDTSSNYLQSKGGHYDLAIREIQLSLAQSYSWSGTVGLIRSVEALTSILQLLFGEVRCLTQRPSLMLIFPL
jgi:hypothetical protein